MKNTKVVIVGAGNISNTRHIPALKKLKGVEIVGVISNKKDRAEQTAARCGTANYFQIDINHKDGVGGLRNIEWMAEADAWVVGAPPHLHYPLVKIALKLGKHVLVEKPMMMNDEECKELISLAKKKHRIFHVMHNFQYANKMLKLNEIIKSEKYGKITSITEVQFTNHDRRLPVWYNDLPFGLFYDEAAHFMYLLERHAGKVDIDNVYAVYDEDKTQATPVTLTVNATAGETPVTMMLDFRAPVCEWYYIVNFKKRIFIYDFFKDILISLPTDNEHLAKDILGNSLRQTWQYWSQFIANGFRLVTGNLLYGHDKVLGNFIEAINGGTIDEHITAEQGRVNVATINDIIKAANSR